MEYILEDDFYLKMNITEIHKLLTISFVIYSLFQKDDVQTQLSETSIAKDKVYYVIDLMATKPTERVYKSYSEVWLKLYQL